MLLSKTISHENSFPSLASVIVGLAFLTITAYGQTPAATQHLKKDGTVDKRYKSTTTVQTPAASTQTAVAAHTKRTGHPTSVTKQAARLVQQLRRMPQHTPKQTVRPIGDIKAPIILHLLQRLQRQPLPPYQGRRPA